MGSVLALDRVDLTFHGGHTLVEGEARTRIVQRVLDFGGQPQVVCCGQMVGSHQFGLPRVAAVYVLHGGAQIAQRIQPTRDKASCAFD